MAFRKKFKAIMDLKADILIVQECEHKEKIISIEEFPPYTNFIWIGENRNKGVGIISFNNYKIELSEDYDARFKYIIPVNILGKTQIQLFAIWAMPSITSKKHGYVGQIWNALQYYKIEKQDNSILIGDWNSNVIWDPERKTGNHTAVVDLLLELNITSLYHKTRIEKHGEETVPTLFFLKKQTKPYHLDYCFLSESLITTRTNIEIGKYEDWIVQSDHMPLVIDNLNA